MFTRTSPDETGRPSQVRAVVLAAGHLEEDARRVGFHREGDHAGGEAAAARHNQGRKWEPVPAGSLRHGQGTRDELQHRHEDG